MFALLYRLFVFPFAESDQLLPGGIYQLQLIMCLLSFFAAMSRSGRSELGGKYSCLLLSCFLSMHCFCDCFTNTKHFPRHLVLSLLPWTLKELDRWGFTIIHSLVWPASESGWVTYEGSGVLFGLFVRLFVCIASFHSAIVTDVFCLLQFLSTFKGYGVESED